jgi:hypothetical protein
MAASTKAGNLSKGQMKALITSPKNNVIPAGIKPKIMNLLLFG